MGIDNLSYDQLKFIKSGLSTVGMISATGAGYSALSNLPDVLTLAIPIFISSEIASIYLSKVIKKYEDPIYELYGIADDIINELVKYSKILDNKTIIEHFVFIGTLFDNGYLDFDKKNVIADNKNMPSFEDLVGYALTLNSHGICRHIAPFLYKYFNHLGYDSDLVCGYVDYINSNDNNILKSLIFKDADSSNYNISDEELSRLCNHVLTRVNDDEYSYYLDLALKTNYYNTNNIYVSRNTLRKFIPAHQYCSVFNKEYRITNIEDKNTMDILEGNKLFDNTVNKIRNNVDILESFYKDNVDKLVSAEENYQLLLTKHF